MELTTGEAAVFACERAEYAALLRHVRHPAGRGAAQGLQLICIGNTGGAASVVQGKPCGGFLMRHGGRTLIVDPGDNSVSNLARHGFNVFEITDVLASHSHNDHVGDLSLATSAAIGLGLNRGGDPRILVAPSLVDYSNPDLTRLGFTLPAYAWKAQVEMLYPSAAQATRFDGKLLNSIPETVLPGNIRVTATEARHSGIPVTGFVLETDMGKIGYTSDTEYFEGLERWFEGVDVLWMNMNTLALDAMIPAHAPAPQDLQPVHNHLGYVGVCKLVEAVRPKLAVVSHFGAQIAPRRAAIQALLQDRFAPLGVNAICPRNRACLNFDRGLSADPSQCRL